MKEYIREKNFNFKFSLHDAAIIDFVRQNDNLFIKTDYGYIDILENKCVDGDILITDVSFEDSYVYLMEYKEVLCGNIGNFKGEKICLDTFVKSFSNNFLKLDVIGEYDSYNTIVLSGFLSNSKDIFEAWFEIYFDGDFIYRTY